MNTITIENGNNTLDIKNLSIYDIKKTSVFYRKTTDKIGRIINKDPQHIDRQILSYENYDSSDSYGIEISGSYKPKKWWTIRPS